MVYIIIIISFACISKEVVAVSQPEVNMGSFRVVAKRSVIVFRGILLF